MIRGGFARRVGGVGSVRRAFSEVTARTETAEDLVGRYLKKPERTLIDGRQLRGESPTRLEQHQGASHVRLDERLRGINRTIDMRLGGEIQYGLGTVLCEQP